VKNGKEVVKARAVTVSSYGPKRTGNQILSAHREKETERERIRQINRFPRVGPSHE